MTISDIENFADNYLSSFDGVDEMSNFDGLDFQNFSGDMNAGFYTGAGDDIVDFGGDYGSFATEGQDSKVFIMTITNTSTATRYAYIIPGNLWYRGTSANGIPLDGTFDDKNGNSGLSAAGSPDAGGAGTPISDLYAFLANTPIRLVAMKIESSISSSQVNQIMTVTHNSPFRNLGSEEIFLGKYQGQDTYRDKVSGPFPLNQVAANQTRFELPVLGNDGSSNNVVTVTFYFGAALNAASTLQKKAQKAHQTIAMAGLGNLQRASLAKQLASRGQAVPAFVKNPVGTATATDRLGSLLKSNI